MITLRNVEVLPAWHHKTWVLRRIDLEVKEGDFLSSWGLLAPQIDSATSCTMPVGPRVSSLDQPVHKLKGRNASP
jgi:hypothetical protein